MAAELSRRNDDSDSDKSIPKRTYCAFRWVALGLTVLICLFLYKFRPGQSTVTVDTPRGRVVGFHVSLKPSPLSDHSASGNVFLGIPYVHPPIGKRRFKRPEPLRSYGSTPLHANKLRPACPQHLEKIKLEMSEDCLYLDVITPSYSSPRRHLYPVMVYIHGGSFNAGFSSLFDHQGYIRNLVRHGVVVVQMQYRIGALGFFNTGSEDFPSNLGMLDQVEALRWVKSEIASFGGDPNRVTLFGSSAGAASVSAHTYSPLSRGLFHSVILQSGSILTCLDGALGSTDPSRVFAEKMCNFSPSDWERRDFSRLHDCLDSMDTTTITEFEKGNYFGWKMVQDPSFLPSSPQNLASSRRNVPVLIGSMRDEFYYFIRKLQQRGLPPGKPLLPLVTSLVVHDQAQLQTLLPLMMSEYGNTSSPEAEVKSTSDALTGGAFVAQMQRDIRQWIENGNENIFIYEITHPSHVIGFSAIGDWDPAVHSGELPYVSAPSFFWNTAMANNWTTPEDFPLMEWIGKAWTNFAIYGIPSPSWSPVSRSSSRLPYLEISSTERRMKPDYRSRDEKFWNEKVKETFGELPMQKVFENSPIE